MSQEDKGGQAIIGVGGSNMVTIVVSDSAETPDRLPLVLPGDPGLLIDPSNNLHPLVVGIVPGNYPA